MREQDERTSKTLKDRHELVQNATKDASSYNKSAAQFKSKLKNDVRQKELSQDAKIVESDNWSKMMVDQHLKRQKQDIKRILNE